MSMMDPNQLSQRELDRMEKADRIIKEFTDRCVFNVQDGTVLLPDDATENEIRLFKTIRPIEHISGNLYLLGTAYA